MQESTGIVSEGSLLPLPPNIDAHMKLMDGLDRAGPESGSHQKAIIMFVIAGLILLSIGLGPFLFPYQSANESILLTLLPMFFPFLIVFLSIACWVIGMIEFSKSALSIAGEKIDDFLGPYLLSGEKVLVLLNIRRLGASLWLVGTSEGGLLAITTHRCFLLLTKPSIRPIFKLMDTMDNFKIQLCDIVDPDKFKTGGTMFPLGLNLSGLQARICHLGSTEPKRYVISPKDGPNAVLLERILSRRDDSPSIVRIEKGTNSISIRDTLVSYSPPPAAEKVHKSPLLNIADTLARSHLFERGGNMYGCLYVTTHQTFGENLTNDEILSVLMLKGQMTDIRKKEKALTVGDKPVRGWEVQFDLDNQPIYARLAIIDSNQPVNKGDTANLPARIVIAFWGPASESYETSRDLMMLVNSIQVSRREIPQCRREFSVIYSSLALSLLLILFGDFIASSLSNSWGAVSLFPIVMINFICIAGLIAAFWGVRKRLYWAFASTPVVLFFTSFYLFLMYSMHIMDLMFLRTFMDIDAGYGIGDGKALSSGQVTQLLSILGIVRGLCWLHLIVTIITTLTVIRSFKKLVQEEQ